MWHYILCFTIYVQKPVSILFIDKLHVRCHWLWQLCWLYNLFVGCYSAAFSDVTIVLTHGVKIVLAPIHGNVNNASLGEQWGAFQNKPSDLWCHSRNQRQKRESFLGSKRRGHVIFQVTWLKIGDRKRAQLFCFASYYQWLFWGLWGQIQTGESLYAPLKVQRMLYWGTASYSSCRQFAQ